MEKFENVVVAVWLLTWHHLLWRDIFLFQGGRVGGVSPGFFLPFVREQYVNSLLYGDYLVSNSKNKEKEKIPIFVRRHVCRVAVKLVVQLLAGRRVAFTWPVE